MARLRLAFAALLAIPLADALLLVYVAGLIGWQVTVALVVLTALLGMLFVRAEGRHTLRKIQRSLAEGSPPTNEIIDGGLLIAAGAFLLTPGLVTDTVGLLLVLPLTRIPIRAVLKRYVLTPYVDEQTGGFATGNVYTFGFPNDGGGGGWTTASSGQAGGQPGGGQSSGGRSAGQTGGPGGSTWGPGGTDGQSDDDTVDLGPDAYDVDFTDEDDAESGDGNDEDESHDGS